MSVGDVSELSGRGVGCVLPWSSLSHHRCDAVCPEPEEEATNHRWSVFCDGG